MGCTPYGITGGPESINDDNNKTVQDELEVMENPKVFPLEIETFEENIKLKDSNSLLLNTDSGYITKNKQMKIDYKEKGNGNSDSITNFYIFIDQPGKNYPSIEQDLAEILDLLFSSLEVPYDLKHFMENIESNQITLMDTKEVLAELTDNVNSIQIIIRPN